ncbi:MAG: nitroreductase family protein, partial [Pseudoclavibacter sp.]
SMTEAMSNGTFFERYKPYFRFSRAEMERRRDGMLFDRLPAPLRPFTGQVFTPRGQKLMNALRVPKRLGEQNRELVAGSPLLLGVLLDRSEYRPGELSAFYSMFSMGAAMENIWLTTVELGMGIQFISFPMEVPGQWEEIVRILETPDDLELMAVYRLGYVPSEQQRPAIDWSSRERKLPSQFVFRGTCATPQRGWDDTPTHARD